MWTGTGCCGGRRSVFADYKHRPSDNDGVLEPVTYLADTKRGFDRHGIAWVEIDDREADDVIASLTVAQRGDRPVVILSRDRDFYQLVGDGVSVLNNRMRPGCRLVIEATVTETYGVTPAQWPDYRALTGDPADGIPGIEASAPRPRPSSSAAATPSRPSPPVGPAPAAAAPSGTTSTGPSAGGP